MIVRVNVALNRTVAVDSDCCWQWLSRSSSVVIFRVKDNWSVCRSYRSPSKGTLLLICSYLTRKYVSLHIENKRHHCLFLGWYICDYNTCNWNLSTTMITNTSMNTDISVLRTVLWAQGELHVFSLRCPCSVNRKWIITIQSTYSLGSFRFQTGNWKPSQISWSWTASQLLWNEQKDTVIL